MFCAGGGISEQGGFSIASKIFRNRQMQQYTTRKLPALYTPVFPGFGDILAVNT
jgi:hypothetical protein